MPRRTPGGAVPDAATSPESAMSICTNDIGRSQSARGVSTQKRRELSYGRIVRHVGDHDGTVMDQGAASCGRVCDGRVLCESLWGRDHGVSVSEVSSAGSVQGAATSACVAGCRPDGTGCADRGGDRLQVFLRLQHRAAAVEAKRPAAAAEDGIAAALWRLSAEGVSVEAAAELCELSVIEVRRLRRRKPTANTAADTVTHDMVVREGVAGAPATG